VVLPCLVFFSVGKNTTGFCRRIPLWNSSSVHCGGVPLASHFPAIQASPSTLDSQTISPLSFIVQKSKSTSLFPCFFLNLSCGSMVLLPQLFSYKAAGFITDSPCSFLSFTGMSFAPLFDAPFPKTLSLCFATYTPHSTQRGVTIPFILSVCFFSPFLVVVGWWISKLFLLLVLMDQPPSSIESNILVPLK